MVDFFKHKDPAKGLIAAGSPNFGGKSQIALSSGDE
jgi:hypothetical protein